MKSFLLFLAYLALGVLGGWISIKSASPKKRSPATSTSHSKLRDDRKPAASWKGEDFYQAALKRTAYLKDPAYTPLVEILADWTDDEIRSVLDESLKDPDTLTRGGGSAGMLLREYIRRNHDAALHWFEEIPAIHQKNLFMTLSHAWPPERALEGLEFLRQNKTLFAEGGSSPWSILAKSIAKKADSGPEVVIVFLREIREEGFSLQFGNTIAYPSGFDFGAMLDSEDFKDPRIENLRSSALASWRSQSMEAALEWVISHGDKRDLLALASYREDWTPEMRTSLIGSLNRTTPDQRELLLKSKANEWTEPGRDASIWIEQAPTPELKQEFRTLASQGLYTGKPNAALSVIEAIPQIEDRLRFLETLQPSLYLRSTAPLKPENQKILHAKLIEWNVDSNRATAIIDRFKNTPKP